MKKRTLIVLIVSFILTTCLTGCFVTRDILKKAGDTANTDGVMQTENIYDKEAILNSFDSNYEMFNDVANYIASSNGFSRFFIDQNKLKVLVDLEKVDINSIAKADEISYIFNNSGISLIDEVSDGVYFAQPRKDFEDGIVFMKNDVIPESHSPSITYTLIKDNWYYYVWQHAEFSG